MATERSAQQREPLDLDGLITTLREWADKIEGDPSGIVAFFLRFVFAEKAMVESAGEPGRTLLVEGAGGGQTWVFGDWVEDADADEGYEDNPCGCAECDCDGIDGSCDACTDGDEDEPGARPPTPAMKRLN